MILVIGMWVCILYATIRYVLKIGNPLSIIVFSFIIFCFFTLLGSDAGHIGLGMSLGIVFALFSVICVLEGERRVVEESKTKKEIKWQNKYDDDLGFNDFNK